MFTKNSNLQTQKNSTFITAGSIMKQSYLCAVLFLRPESGRTDMKRCPVCGVMMGDNVARCSMCKYDFQKASQGDVNSAAEDAKKVLEQKEQEKIARAEAKRSEEEKRIIEAMEKLERDYNTMQDKFNSEKLKLDSEFSAFQKKKLDEKIALEQTVDTIRNEVGEAREKRDAMRKEAEGEWGGGCGGVLFRKECL